MSRGTEACIDLAALQANFAVLRARASSSRVLSVIKADGYGHGLIPVARALADSDGFGVATLREALALRAAGIRQPIVLLEGVFTLSEWQQAAQWDISLVVHQREQLSLLEQVGSVTPVSVWLKVNTGMHRLGLELAEVADAMRRLQGSSLVRDIVLMSHFACADEADAGMTDQQATLFASLLSQYPGVKASLANSAGVFRSTAYHYDWVRPGLALYGASPLLECSAQSLNLQPVMTLQARLIAIRRVPVSETVGYGATWQAQRDTRLGIVSIGYGDGYPRHLDTTAVVKLRDMTCAVVGRVSMDMIAIDVTDVPNLQLGEPVVLWGRGLPVERLAASAGTVNYELLCQVTDRAERRYLHDTPAPPLFDDSESLRVLPIP